MPTTNPKTKGGKMKTANELIIEMYELMWDERVHMYSKHDQTAGRLCNLSCDIYEYIENNLI